MRKRRVVVIAALVVALELTIAVSLLVWWWRTDRAAGVTVLSRRATYIAEPRDRNGLPDYRGYLRMHQLGAHPASSNALLDLHAVLGSEVFRKDARTWVAAELGVSVDHPGEFVRTEVYAPTACALDRERCTKALEAALQQGCSRLSGDVLDVARAWVSANRQALDLTVRASRRPVLYVPIDEWGSSSLDVVSLLRLEKALACRGALRSGDGEYEAAAGDVLALWKLGELSLTGHGLPLGMVGIADIGMGDRVASELAGNDRLPQVVADQLLRSVPVMDERSIMIEWINQERIETLTFVLGIARSRMQAGKGVWATLIGRSRAIDLEAVLRRVNDSFDLLERAASVPTHAARVNALEIAAKTLDARRRPTVTPIEAIACAAPLPRRWCAANDFISDLATGTHAFAHTTLPKLQAKLEALESTRRALLEATRRHAVDAKH